MCRIDTITADDLEAVRHHLDAIDSVVASWALAHQGRRNVTDNLDSIRRILGPPPVRIPFGKPPPSDHNADVVAVDGG